MHHLFWASATMSKHRFKFLCSKLKFDDTSTRTEREKYDKKLFKMSELFEKFRKTLSTAYDPGENLVVDETLYGLRGKCSFRQYIPSKPAKYGLKFWNLVCNAHLYVLDTDIYIGKARADSPTSSNVGETVVTNLVKRYFKSWRTVTADNFFTSVSLAKSFWKHGMKLIGTLRKNKAEIPIEFKPNTRKEILSSLFGFLFLTCQKRTNQ